MWKSEILNLVKTAIISSRFCSKINRKFIITKDPIIMTWVPSYYMVNLLLIRREGLWFTQKETPSCCAGCRPADNCLAPASFKQEHSPGKTIFCDKVCMRAQLFMAFDSCWNYVECALMVPLMDFYLCSYDHTKKKHFLPTWWMKWSSRSSTQHQFKADMGAGAEENMHTQRNANSLAQGITNKGAVVGIFMKTTTTSKPCSSGSMCFGTWRTRTIPQGLNSYTVHMSGNSWGK